MSLNHACLLDLRDRVCLPEGFMAAAGADQLGRWLDQLDAAIDAGTVDPRPSWEIEEAEAADRAASTLLARLAPMLHSALTANDTPAKADGAEPTQAASPPDLVRARDAGMTSREWRGAIRRGELRASKIGREYVAARTDYDTYLAAKRVAVPPRRQRRKRDADPASTAVERALASGRLRAIIGGGER